MSQMYFAIKDASEFFDYVLEVLDKYEKLGPLPGVLLPYFEAFLPFLPLFVFVMANSVAYGLFKGFLYSWIGSSLGSITVFFLVRMFKHRPFMKKITNNKQVAQVTNWVERRGFGLIFILLCFPFSPSSVINIVAGMSNVSRQQFFLAVLLGKAVMIFSIAYIGTSALEFAKNPVKTIVVSTIIIVFWMVGKLLEKRLLQKDRKKGGEK